MTVALLEGQHIDRESPLPLHVQVEQLLRRLIQNRRYQDGELLPDELTLASRLGVSRGTVRTAVSRMVSEGVVERRKGVGTRVARRPAESAIVAWRSLTREMAAQGLTVETYQLGYAQRPATAAAATALAIAAETPIWRLDRLRGWNGCPVLHSRSWFHPRLGLDGTEDFRKPLYEVLEAETRVVPGAAREELLAVWADARMAALLRVPRHSPLLLRRHVVLDRAGRAFELAEVHYVSDRYTLTIDLKRGTR